MYINYFRLCNISGGLHHDNPFTSATNLPLTESKSAMSFALAPIRERNLQRAQPQGYKCIGACLMGGGDSVNLAVFCW